MLKFILLVQKCDKYSSYKVSRPEHPALSRVGREAGTQAEGPGTSCFKMLRSFYDNTGRTPLQAQEGVGGRGGSQGSEPMWWGHLCLLILWRHRD